MDEQDTTEIMLVAARELLEEAAKRFTFASEQERQSANRQLRLAARVFVMAEELNNSEDEESTDGSP